MRQRHATPHRPRRGFTLILVVMMVAVVVIMITGALEFSGQALLATSKERAEPKARNLAELCLDRTEALARQYARGAGITDFDGLLDPNLAAAPDGDEFVPSNAQLSGGDVYVPKAESGAAEPRKGLHRYRLHRESDGACLVRLDDNSDDNKPGLVTATSNSTVVEGGGNDVAHRDRDRGIVITAIGVFPARGVDADVYGNAAARVTLRRLVTSGGAPGMYAGDEITIKEDTAVCGEGGLMADDLTYVGGGSAAELCACGDVMIDSGAAPAQCTGAHTSAAGAACNTPATCRPGNTTTGTPPPVPDVVVPAFGTWRDNTVGPGGTVANLGTNNMCELYFKDTGTDGDIYVWDHTDVGNSCDNASPAPIPTPCAWNAGGTMGACAAGQSPCWKLVARVEVGGAGQLLNGVAEHTIIDGGKEYFAPNNGAAIPNVTDNTRRWNTLCGTCSGCTGAAGRETFTVTAAGNTWGTKNTVLRSYLPSPLVMLFEHPVGEPVELEDDFGNGGVVGTDEPIIATLLVQNRLLIKRNTSLCCATCNCAGTAVWPVAPLDSTQAARANGVALRAGDDCYFRENTHVVGSVSCGTLNIKENSSVVGAVTSHVSRGGGAGLPGGWDECVDELGISCDDPGVCIKESSTVVGTVLSKGDVCVKQGSTFYGSVLSEDDIYFKENSTVYGQVVAEDDIAAKEGVTVNNDGNGALGASTRRVAWMDQGW